MERKPSTSHSNNRVATGTVATASCTPSEASATTPLMVAEVALVPGATAPRDGAFACAAVGCADDKLSAIALALGAVLERAAVPFARARRLRRLGGRRRGREVKLKPIEHALPRAFNKSARTTHADSARCAERRGISARSWPWLGRRRCGWSDDDSLCEPRARFRRGHRRAGGRIPSEAHPRQIPLST